MKTLNDYQAAALRTAGRKPGEEVSPELNLATLALGLTGEAGEVADIIKKHVGHGHPLDRTKLARELGDVLWYVAVLARDAGLSLEEVAAVNVAKLRARYPDGFSRAESINRVDGS